MIYVLFVCNAPPTVHAGPAEFQGEPPGSKVNVGGAGVGVGPLGGGVGGFPGGGVGGLPGGGVGVLPGGVVGVPPPGGAVGLSSNAGSLSIPLVTMPGVFNTARPK